jgi:hypothetical protein
MARLPHAALAATAAATLMLAACGDRDRVTVRTSPSGTQGAPDGSAPSAPTPTIPLSPSQPGRRPSPDDRGAGTLALPAGVPTKASRAGAPAASRTVIDGWLRALRAGRIARAAAFFAQPSKVQNGTPVLTLDSARERLAFNLALPCGARADRYGTNGRYTIIEFVLTERRGGDCAGAAGQPARGAIRVDGGRITEWYRLADDPDADPSQPPLPPRSPRIDPGDVGAV